MKPAMKTRLFCICLSFCLPGIIMAQGTLSGTWKFSVPEGEVVLEFSGPNSLRINGEQYPYRVQGNILQVSENNVFVDYPYSLSGDQLILVFPDGTPVTFTRIAATSRIQQAVQAPSNPVRGAPGLSGRWDYRHSQGVLSLEFLPGNQLLFDGETTNYQLVEGAIRAMTDYGWQDYPYQLQGNNLLITFPDGTQITFSRAAEPAAQSPVRSQAGSGKLWQLQGSLCYYSGSSGAYSSYSRVEKLQFDGAGRFVFGNETSFSSEAGLAYGNNDSAYRGTYSIEGKYVILQFENGNRNQLEIYMQQNSGRITELMYNGKLYAASLCE